MSPPLLFAAGIGVPLLLLVACAFARARGGMRVVLGVAAIPALVLALAADFDVVVRIGREDGFALSFMLDLPGAMLLVAAAVLWIAGGFYAGAWLRGRAGQGAFAVCWLMTLAGCVGVFCSADLVGFYMFLALLSVGASGLVMQGSGPQASRAGALYLALALIAEAFLLAGLILLFLVMPEGSLLIADARAALAGSPLRDATIALLLIGLGMKAGLLPLHFWMPVAYGAAPIPAAAVMSGAVVKASVLAMLRMLPFDAALPSVGHALAAVGLAGAFYGVVIGLLQRDPKLVLAYSSVSQMGFLCAMVGMGLASAAGATPVLASFYATHHLLVKGALFLAVGIVAFGGRNLLAVTLPAAFIGLGLAGFPLSGGMLAKYASKDLMGEGLAGTLADATSVTSTLLMLHFMHRLGRVDADVVGATRGTMMAAWIVMVVASVVVPWAFYATLPLGTVAAMLDPATLGKAAWPVLVGAALAWGWRRVADRAPAVPAGDILAWLGGLAAVSGRVMSGAQSLDGFVRRWTVACVLLVVATAAVWVMLIPPGFVTG